MARPEEEAFHSSILDLEVAGQSQQVLLRDVQYHPFKQLVLHVDFQRVDAKKKLHTKAPLHFLNAEISPAVKLSSAIVSHVATEIEIECLPADLPEFLEVDLSKIEAGQSLHAKDITLPRASRWSRTSTRKTRSSHRRRSRLVPCRTQQKAKRRLPERAAHAPHRSVLETVDATAAACPAGFLRPGGRCRLRNVMIKLIVGLGNPGRNTPRRATTPASG